MNDGKSADFSHEQLENAVAQESEKFRQCYQWLEKMMPPIFFEEINKDTISLITHALIGLDLQGYFSTINIKHAAVVMCLDSPDADLRILKDFATYGIQSYQCFISASPPPCPNCRQNLRIALIYFTGMVEAVENACPADFKEKVRMMLQERDAGVSDSEFNKLLSKVGSSFLRVLPTDRIALALDMFFRAKTRDSCQYEVRYNEDWQERKTSSMQIVLAWKNTPKYNFLYQIAEVIHRYNLVMKKVSASYIDPYSRNSILVMALDLHGANGQATWDVADIPDFLRAFATLKYFASNDSIDTKLVSKGIVSGNNGTFLKAMAYFIYQALVHIDPNLYTLDRIKEDLCYQPELTIQLCEAFYLKLSPTHNNYEAFLKAQTQFKSDVDKLDSGSEGNDKRRKNVLRMGISFIHHTLKTNFFRTNYTSLSFRLDPLYLKDIPFDEGDETFPVMPYAVFFILGLHFFGFHIRFKDLARGGLRTVYLEHSEQLQQESNNVFMECYNLALTQQMKNKDIPEGGAKGIIFLKPWDRLDSEALILENELRDASIPEAEIASAITTFRKEQKEEYLYQAQRAFIEGLVILINCNAEGEIKAKSIVDYLKQPEYIYLGPDENMHDSMITWIAAFSKRYGYKPGSSFISGKPTLGINHKEYGVTSLGVNVYMEAILHYLNIDPYKDIFTLKMSGGPDGDVAGNQIVNLARYYPNTAKLLALIDASGTIYDPQGLDLHMLAELFHQGRPIKYYPPEKLSEGGFLLDKNAKRHQTAFAQQTLCWKNMDGNLIEDWMSGGEMNHLLRYNVHQTKADIFIPAGGRPRTLNAGNIKEFMDETGKPTARAIVEGANLYLTPGARNILEKLGVLIIKDSSANKTGVICSSFEVLCGLALGDEKFLANKNLLLKEILDRLKQCALNEANLLLSTHRMSKEPLTDISEDLSKKINLYTYQLLDYLTPLPLNNDPNDALMRCFFDYCLPTLRTLFKEELLREIPDSHKKAIIASHLGSQLVYDKGLEWEPSVIDVLPLLLGGA